MFVGVMTVQAQLSLNDLLGSLGRDGREFELLCKWLLENDPEFQAEYQHVWTWAQWPGRWGPDRGIDLIAQTFDGRIDAIQAKNYGADHSVTKRDIDTFLSESNRSGIGHRLLIASTDKVSRSAREVMAQQEKPVTTCLLSRLQASPVQWPTSMARLVPQTIPAAMPREHQSTALEAIERWARTNGARGQVIMACGTGKSLVEIWAADRLAAQRVLVLVPTIPLLRQLARDWSQHASIRRRMLRICSDKTAIDAEDLVRGDELSGARTTDSSEIAAVLGDGEPLVALCTYDSSPVLAQAMALVPEFVFDVAIADEAHRCAGLEASRHKTVLDGSAIRATRRLFFTATPTVYGTRDKSRAASRNVRLASMDDRALFGPVIHHLSFAQAIARDLLCPYQVAVIPIDDDEVHGLIRDRRIVTADGDHNLEAAALATQIACARAMSRFGCRRIVAFHPTIAGSRRFSAHFPVAVEMLPKDDHPELPVWAEHVDGAGMGHATRSRLLARFQSSEPAEHRLLSNVRLLTEGVDVPGIDAIAFIDTRRGQGSIIQAVGRAVRPAPGKTVGTIVLPVVLRKGESFDVALARSEHRSIVDVLGALRSHDPDIIKSLDDLRFNEGSADQVTRPGRFRIDAPLQVGEEFAAAVDLALTSALGVASRSTRRRPRELEPRFIAESQQLSEEELLAVGINQLASLGRWELLPAVPPDDGRGGFPLQACWEEVKRRWRRGALADADRLTIANCVSWLAPDLDAHPRQRLEMAALTDADVPEQIASHCRSNGRYGSRAEVLSDWPQDELLEAITRLQDHLTHPGMSPGLRLRYALLGFDRLCSAVSMAIEMSGEDWWDPGSWRRAATDGFIYALELAAALPVAKPNMPWTAGARPAAFFIGRHEGGAFAPLTARLRIYRSSGDVAAVESRQREERSLLPDEKLDAVGWEVFLLASHRGDTRDDALKLGMEGTCRVRLRIRADLRQRSIRELET